VALKNEDDPASEFLFARLLKNSLIIKAKRSMKAHLLRWFGSRYLDQKFVASSILTNTTGET